MTIQPCLWVSEPQIHLKSSSACFVKQKYWVAGKGSPELQFLCKVYFLKKASLTKSSQVLNSILTYIKKGKI